MYVIRPVIHDDLNDLLELATVMAPGITTFPPNKDKITEKITQSIASFDEQNTGLKQHSFLLVLEDLEQRRIAGTAGVYSNIGYDKPFYSYKITSQTQHNYSLDIQNTSQILHLVNDFQGGTEVGTLLLHPDYAGQGLGKLLAKSRYLLIRAFKALFNEPVFAELRGWTDENDQSPFWNAVGAHFFAGLAFDKADLLSATTDNQFIADLMPRYPIYVDLLPQEAQEAIGKANKKGQAALTMLFNEGFRDEGYIDIFDAGATVVANFNDIETIRESRSVQTEVSIHDNTSDKALLISNGRLEDFRVIQTTNYQLTAESVVINPSVAEQLHIANNSVLIF